MCDDALFDKHDFGKNASFNKVLNRINEWLLFFDVLRAESNPLRV